ncbi:hypothetical protein [Leptospira idonii]|uniref:Uncharacterized protein n=1 Tax=Leptospira idonii TaxID=1193500 RepID=A0A4R9M2I8_9LEPT|nr:hypothetical protein [Leptospira idonii]TGN20332.1 hypothetical protein EHS15_03730 [Leptospira idonii]
MDIASGVARVSGLGEPVMYASPTFNTQAIEKVEPVQAKSYRPKYPSEDTSAQAEAIQGNQEMKSQYKPGDLVNLYA